MKNSDYESGYSMGYEWIKYNGGNISLINSELKNRGKHYKLGSWGHGFKQGALDAHNKNDKKY
jgi:hypothetical protein